MHVKNNNAGFTLVEIIVVIAILALLAAIAIPNFSLIKQKTDLSNSTQEVANALRLAQNKTLVSEANSQYGVYFDTSVSPNRYVVYEGSSYATRTASADLKYYLPTDVQFTSISLGGASEVVFDKLTGAADQSGSFALQLKSDATQTKTIYVSSSGTVAFTGVQSPSDSARTKDSRHIQFDYNRTLTLSCPGTDQTLSLYFDGSGTAQQTISMCSNLVAGQLSWSGTVVVGGANQVITISTHHLNDVGYANINQFSIHRDRRYNTKSLIIKISGDSGTLAQYSADGLTTSYTSTYVLNSAWQ